MQEKTDAERIIFHVDVNSAFLSWSAVKQLQENPSAVDLRTIPSAVGGDVKTRHGIITAKSIPAKKYGIHTGEPVVQALKKCPMLVMVPGDFAAYHRFSEAFIAILKQYAPEVEQVSIDEAYLDMTQTRSLFYHCIEESKTPFPICVAEKLKNEIRDTLGFTVNVGISTNKLLAKMASDFEKPDKIHTLYPGEVPQKMWPLPIQRLYGCGKQSAKKLREMGIATIGEAADTSPEVLQQILGEKSGWYIYQSANGISTSPVKNTQREAKSYSNETTMATDISDANFNELALPIVRRLAESVGGRLRKDGVYARTIEVSVKTDDFKRHSRQMACLDATNVSKEIEETAIFLLKKMVYGKNGLFENGQHVRLIGVGGLKIDHGEFRQMNLFETSWQKVEKKQSGHPLMAKTKDPRLDAMRDEIQKAYGKDALKLASDLKPKKK